MYSELVAKCQAKTLLYFCVFSNPDYIKLLKLLFISLVLYTEDLSQIDLLVFTSSDLQQEINTIKQVFINICADIKYRSEKSIALPVCSDQSYINYYFIKENIYNNTYLSKYTKFYSKGADLNLIDSDNILCHFTWPIGNAINKLERMSFFLNKISSESLSEYFHPKFDIIGKSYSWNMSGQIIFNANNILTTTWATGRWRWLNSYLLEASWDNFYHILRFNKDYTSFISIRGDFNISNGSI